ncbi:MAG TPA: alpha-L-fucosidase, partial [Sediminibacterium sp.]|nr:alpha-L-fucosidase [Sediminibacterium sp.]
MAFSQNGDGVAQSKVNDPKMQWWRDSKFGMFIHWGIYSVPAGKWDKNTNYGEWIMHSAKIPRSTYSALAKEFNPTQFNAEEWVKLAKAAGQKYMVITSKHHDGFAMYGSKASAYNIVDATPFKRDILKELADACRKHGMKLGFYYSQAQDWYHPGGAVSGNKDWDSSHIGSMEKYIDDIAIPQVKEILANYGDVAILWWDTPTNMTSVMTQKLAAIAKQYPQLITNNRLGAGMGGDLETPEQFIPATGFPGRNWEVCMTMNGHWGYNAWDDRWKSTKELTQKLVDIVSKGGNFLLNVGPNAYGVIPVVCQQNLLEMGEWLQLNGESIYGTTASPFPYLSWGRATRKGQTIYLHVFDWPTNGKLGVPLGNKIKSSYLLADKNHALTITAQKNSSVLQLPAYAPDKMSSVIAIEFEGEPNVLPIVTSGKSIIASSTDVSTITKHLNDGNPNTKWQAQKGETKASLEIDLGSVVAINAMSLVEPWHPWSGIKQTHELQYLDAGVWKSITKLSTDGTGSTESFKEIKAQKFRLLLENQKEAPSIGEFILYRAE